ncbi:hypothetical protein M406DRAFT_352836 [Cryphonectria parasitica EP155]|uniref:Uncharacterized protein n=1 Tax=Cryphonectria parasitica (strain ATCC 38755 / EP155) TaxID=660469 RepID=A0A9P4XX95_CRYP1|nr:uncharacterized protein M406DRAFT_352836 [Cryphonectria parasitica EP155]KAF3762586.1 hypothetical protein M406DRAFT_352836 [Cryphonectria parasitica EP155]
MADMAALATTSVSQDNLDITGAQVILGWRKPDGLMCYLPSTDASSTETGHVTLDCHFRPLSNTASLRLRAPILLKGLGRKVTPLFLFVAPERIQSLVYEHVEENSGPEVLHAALGNGGIASLQLRLKHPADLVVPPLEPLVPKKKAYWDVLDSLKMLAQETEFVIYVKQDRMPSTDRLSPFCQAVAAGSLTTSTVHADVSRLYDGKGGKLLESESLAVPAPGTIHSPPSYDELTAPPPALTIEKEPSQPSHQEAPASGSKKRRRTSSSAEEAATRENARCEPNVDTVYVEAICRKLLGEMNAKWREESDQLRSELRQMETRMKDWVDERLSAHATELRDEMQRTNVQQQNQVHDEVHEARLELQEARDEAQATAERLEEVMVEVKAVGDEVSDVVDGRLDERLEHLRGELED